MQFFPFALAFNPQSLLTIGMLVLVVVVFYFLLIRPQGIAGSNVQEKA